MPLFGYIATLAVAVAVAVTPIIAGPYNTFDGDGFPACRNVAAVHDATSIDDMVSIVKKAATAGTHIRASGKGHMWYDTMCSDHPNTIIIRTENVNKISNLVLKPGAESGSVDIEAGVTFLQLAEWLHDRNASVGYTLVNWNITVAGAIAMGAHRSSIREDSMVAAGVISMDIINGNGKIVTVKRDNKNDDWLAASTSLGLLGVIARLKFKIYPDFKVYAQQEILSEDEVLNGDIYGLIAPYATANLWWWPYNKKFHWRYYDQVPTTMSDQQGFQNTFSLTDFEAGVALATLNSGKYLASSNWFFETTAFAVWSVPNFREKTTWADIRTWPVYGWNYDVLIGGLYPDQRPEWDYGLHGYTLELAFPVVMANRVLKRVRRAFDAEGSAGRIMASTYRSGINVKFGKPYFDFLGQVTYGTTDGADWSKGAVMFDFPTFHPTVGDGKRYNEQFYINLATTLIKEFPARPHWTKNTREVFGNATRNMDPGHLARFKGTQRFDPKGTFKSVVGEILGLYD
ncbi:FAD/FMN-containing dehydrogenase [Xylaria sp. CBS 124048]|nr:FAD/FMN-containing dehydrogenase [Xylaria sp. CBS 124048]